MRHLIVGQEHARRAIQWRNVLGDVPVRWLSYQQVAQGEFPEMYEPTTVRITSPGEDFETFKLLVGLGGYPQADQLIFEKGRIYLHAYWYQGWCQVLAQIQTFLQAHPQVRVMNHPAPIKRAFHKVQCQQFLASSGIPIPPIYAEQIQHFDHLLDVMDSQRLHQVFLKPAHGSSASGIMMFRKHKNKMQLGTTIRAEHRDGELKLFNWLRLQQYQDPAMIQQIIELMIPQRLHVEAWIFKKRFQAKSTDFRVVTIDQEPVFVQPRHSSHPITNLHLGNEKGSLERVEAEWGKNVIDNIKTVARETAHLFPDLFYAGIDIALDQENTPYVLEVNPFGDFLQEIFVDGKNTYACELAAWQQKLPLLDASKTHPS